MTSRDAAAAFRAPTVEPVESLAALRAEWGGLVADGMSIFGTWEWADAWWRRYGRDRRLLLHARRNARGSLVGVLPLYAWRERPLRVVRFVGHGPADELGPISIPDARGDEAVDLSAALARLEWDVAVAEQLPGDRDWRRVLGGRCWRIEASPVLHLPRDGWDALLASWSANLRAQARGRRRALERSGRVRFRLADDASLDRDLDALFVLHRGRWAGRRSDFADDPFHRDLARAALRRGWLRLWLLEIDGRPAAAWHGFHVGRVVTYYQAGRDRALDRHSVGFVLLVHTIRAALEEGAIEYRFGRGAEAFKYRFATADPQLESIALARGPAGRLALAGARAARGARRLASARSGAARRR